MFTHSVYMKDFGNAYSRLLNPYRRTEHNITFDFRDRKHDEEAVIITAVILSFVNK